MLVALLYSSSSFMLSDACENVLPVDRDTMLPSTTATLPSFNGTVTATHAQSKFESRTIDEKLRESSLPRGAEPSHFAV